jgi:hypothetical protein
VRAAACTKDEPPRPRLRTTDDTLREAAVSREQALLAAYAAAVPAHPARAAELGQLLTDHGAHLRLLSPATAPTATPGAGRPPSLRALAAQERAAAAAHAKAALSASRDLAALLASLAACEASHAALL